MSVPPTQASMFDHIWGSSVPPYSSSMLNTVAAALSRFFTMLAVTGFLMALAGTARLGVIVPPGASSHSVANCLEPEILHDRSRGLG